MAFKPRMQYTASAHANPVRVTFERFYSPNVHIDRAYEDLADSSGPVHYGMKVLSFFENYLYRPVVRFVEGVALVLQPIQSGDVNW